MNRKKDIINKAEKGFTLIELLVVIGILAVLLAIVLIAINPARQFAQANDTKRRSDVQAILNAINQYSADNAGQLPTGVSTTVANISTAGTGAAFCNALVTRYLAALPTDPTTGTAFANCASYSTGYTVIESSTDNRVTVSATGQITNPISVTR